MIAQVKSANFLYEAYRGCISVCVGEGGWGRGGNNSLIFERTNFEHTVDNSFCHRTRECLRVMEGFDLQLHINL